MTNETLRMQFLSGVITESEYKSMLNENSSKIKDILSKIGDIEEKIYDKYNDEEIDAKFDYSKALDGIKEKYKNDEGKMYDALVSHLNKLKKSFPLQENKESINENFVGIGAINNPFIDRKKETYEDAFEHFLSQKYTLNENGNQALGTLFYEEDGDYFYDEDKLIELIRNMGYDDAEEIANEIMTISSPEDDLEMFRNKYNQPDLGMEGITLDMIKKSIEDEFEK